MQTYKLPLWAFISAETKEQAEAALGAWLDLMARQIETSINGVSVEFWSTQLQGETHDLQGQA